MDISRVSLFYTLVMLVVIPIEVFVGILVLKQNTQSVKNRYFALFALLTAFFSATNYFADVITRPELAILDLRLYFISTSLITVVIFLFLFVFPQEIKVKSWIRNTLAIAGSIAAILSATPLIVQDVEIKTWGSNVVGGPLFMPYNLINLVGLIGFCVFLIRTIRRSKGNARRQLRLLAWGFAIFFVVNLVVNVIMPIVTGTAQYARYGGYASAVFVAFATYAIVAQHLFDIRVVIRRTVIFATLLSFVFIVYAAIILLFTTIFQERTTTVNSFIANLIAALLIGFSFEPLQRWISERTDKWLFKKEYEQQSVLKELSEKLNNVIAMDEAIETVMHVMAKVLHLHHAVTYVFQQAEHGGQAIKRIKQIGYAATQRLILEDKDFTIDYFCHHPQTVLLSDIQLELEREKVLINDKKHPEEYKSLSEFIRAHAIKAAMYKKLESMDIAVAMPLWLKEQPIGLILLSGKQSDSNFTSVDMTLLGLVADQAISSIQKAKLYEGDQMKSEFVSIASHELLTPISAIEGYLSMILDEHIAGNNLDDQTKDYLGKCFASAKRLSMLVKDLLSVSRIESGKMKIEPQQLNLQKTIQDTVDQLRFVAEEKKVTLIFEAPNPPLPFAWADPDRTAQVMVNLVSNAIKYNRPENGTVTITTSLNKHDHLITTSVTDTGMGMNREQMSHLFEKFYRIDSKQTMGILGTGLGLYITKSIVERMGGSINVQSTPEKGSTFSFSVPVLQVENAVPKAE